MRNYYFPDSNTHKHTQRQCYRQKMRVGLHKAVQYPILPQSSPMEYVIFHCGPTNHTTFQLLVWSVGDPKTDNSKSGPKCPVFIASSFSEISLNFAGILHYSLCSVEDLECIYEVFICSCSDRPKLVTNFNIL